MGGSLAGNAVVIKGAAELFSMTAMERSRGSICRTVTMPPTVPTVGISFPNSSSMITAAGSSMRTPQRIHSRPHSRWA